MKKKNIIFPILSLIFIVVVIIITIPVIRSYLNEEEKKSFQNNALKALQIIEQDSIDRNVTTEYIYTISDGQILAGRAEVQKISNLNGTITFDKNQKIEYAIHNKKWCIHKNKAMTTFEITEYNGICEIKPSELEVASEKCFEFSNGEIINYYDYEENNKKNPTCPKKVIIPSTINGENVTTIGKEAFLEKELTSVVIPDTVTLIKEYAFASNAIVDLMFGKNVKILERQAFWNNRLENVTLSDSLVEIKDFVFMDNLISSLTIGKNVISIGLAAFYNNQLEILTIPDNVKTIGEQAFKMNNLKNVALGIGIETIGVSAFAKNEVSIGEEGSSILEKSNFELTTIENNSGRSFDWGSITNEESGFNFTTGIIINPIGNIEIK